MDAAGYVVRFETAITVMAAAALVLVPTALLSLHVRTVPRGPARQAASMNAAADGPPVPPIEVLAERQQVATLLTNTWERAAGMVGGMSGDAAEVGASDVHGLGLFALQDIEAGTLVTLYPVHRVLQALSDGRGAACLADEADEAYFRPEEGTVSPEELAYRQIAYRQTYSHADPARPETFQLDANPAKPDVKGWLGHRINDGATLSPGSSSDEEVLAYYAESGRHRNVCTVALCVPLVGFVATRDVPKGEELLATYGHGYWLQKEAACTEAVEEALQAPAKENVLWQVATDKKYHKQIVALDSFILSTSTRDIEQHLEQRDSTGGAPLPAAAPAAGAPASSRGFGRADGGAAGGGAAKARAGKKRKGGGSSKAR